MGWEAYVIAGVVVAAIVGGLLARGGKSMGASIAEQIARMPGTARPTQKLATAPLPHGRAALLECTAIGGEHSLWLEFDVQGGRSGEWTAEVILEVIAPRPAPAERFAIGYDGEDHKTRPGLTGLLYFPHAVTQTRPENMKLANLDGVRPGERIAVRVTLQGEAAMRHANAYVGVAPTRQPA